MSISSSSVSDQIYPQLEFNMLNADLRRATRISTEKQEIHLGADLLGIVLQGTRKKTVRILLDTGSSNSIILNDFTTDVAPTVTTSWMTKTGTMTTNGLSTVNLILPDFDVKRVIKWQFHVDSHNKISNSRYDMIIGRDLLTALGMVMDYNNKQITWENASTPMHEWESALTYEQADQQLKQHLLTIRELNEATLNDATSRVTEILDAKYEKADLHAVVDSCTNLTSKQKRSLYRLLKKYEPLFDGTLGDWKNSDVSIKLKPDAKPYHGRPYGVPHVYEATFRKEVERLCQLGVLKKENDSEWAAGAFIIPKANGTVRFLSDFRELNKRIVRKPFPIPKIQDLLQKLQGFQYATSLDLNMGYYTIRLDPDAQKLCTIILPWGKYSYQRLPMGVANSPDLFQEKMSELMAGLEFVRTYLDDVLVITKDSFDDHLAKLDRVLARLHEAGLKVNAPKCFFGRMSLEYLGYWLTRDGIAPIPKKIEAMKAIKPPKNTTQLRSFLGLINFYRDMWKKRSHILAPLAALSSKNVKWRWTDVEQNAFDEIKRVISRDVLLAFPDFSKPFVIHTDASKLQLGAVLSQEGRPIAFYSRKLNPAQANYTTGEKELLSIVETLKEYRNILLGYPITVHTDHKNLTFKNFNTERVMRWRLILEEFGCQLNYIKGPKNIVADALSRLPTDYDPEVPTKPPNPAIMAEQFGFDKLPVISILPITTKLIQRHQASDDYLQQQLQTQSQAYSVKSLRGGDMFCYNNKIYVPQSLRKHIVEWYHTVLCHAGETRTEETIKQHMTWPGLREDVRKVIKTCDQCQRLKKSQKKYGHVPPKEAEVNPWEILQVDLVGPYTIRRKGKKKPLHLHAVTMTDPATGWFEIAQIKTKRADFVANTVEQVWLTRYPWPTRIIYDRGGEFLGKEFQDLIRQEYDIIAKPISTSNPQSNAMLERIHQTLGDMVRTLDPSSIDEDDPWAGILAAVAFAIRATYHTTRQASPGQLVFGRDMIWNVKHIANWQLIRDRKQAQINKDNIRENRTRIPHEYKVGDQVLMNDNQAYKYEPQRRGPYQILQVNNNGTVRIQRGAVQDTVNIRQLRPYYSD